MGLPWAKLIKSNKYLKCFKQNYLLVENQRQYWLSVLCLFHLYHAPQCFTPEGNHRDSHGEENNFENLGPNSPPMGNLCGVQNPLDGPSSSLYNKIFFLPLCLGALLLRGLDFFAVGKQQK